MRKILNTVLLVWILLPLNGAGQHLKPQHTQGCVRGGIAYAAASYVGGIDVKKKYARRFDRLTKRPIQQLLCSGELRGLPAQEPDSTKRQADFIEQTYLEPLFINLATLDGLYGVRHYGRVSVRFRCGYFHEIVLIAGKQFYALRKDTAANKQAISQLLGPSFAAEDIERMKRDYNQHYYCSDFTFMPPEIIRRGTKLLFEARTLR